MKKLIVLCILAMFSITLFSQSAWNGFWKPKTSLTISEKSLEKESPWDGFFKPMYEKEIALRAEGDMSREWYFRPAAQMTAIQFTWDKETKQFTSSTFQSAGIGLGYQHYVENNGQLINNYGANLLVIIDASQGSMAGIGIAGTINALQFINAGAGYNLTNDVWFLLMGAVWTFN